MFTSPTNREIRKFHVVVVERGQRNVQKKRDARDFSGARGARDGAVVRALASHQCGPGSIPGVDAICGLSLLLVLSLAPRGFSPSAPVFPSNQKTNTSKFQFDQESGRDEEPLCGCATSKSLFIIYFIIYYLCMCKTVVLLI